MSEYFSGEKKIWNGTELVPDRRQGTRRRYTRFQVNLDGLLECENVFYKCTIVDLSIKGCRVMTGDAIHLESKHIILKFTMQGELDTTIVKGRVKWAIQEKGKYFLGINFDKELPNF